MTESEIGSSAPVVVRVRGSHEVRTPPERGVVHATMGCDGPEAAFSMRVVEEGLASLVDSIKALHDETTGPVVAWSVDQIALGAHRPWNDQGTQLPLVHTARAGVTVTFSDAEALGRWCSQSAEIRGFAIRGVDWKLTDERRAEVEREARTGAARDAMTRAQSYADALDLGPVRVRAISDEGMLPRPVIHDVVPGAAMKSFATEGDLGQMLTPEPLVVRAQVEAEFVTGGGGR